MSRAFSQAQLALMLLTRLPAGRIDGTPPTTAEAAWAFPLVGLVIGGLMAATFGMASALGLSPFISALLALTVGALATGGLHEDGLADVADGFGGGTTRPRKLEIMRDSRIGSFGVLALILVTLLTASAIAEAASAGLFLVIGAASRTAMLWPMCALRPARDDGLGHGAALTPDRRTGIALLITLLVALPSLAIAPLIAIALASLAVMALARAQIGGQTGDVLGATQKLAECAGWLMAAALTG